MKYAFAANMNRPAGNMTGTVLYSSDLIIKRMEMLKELNPSATRFAFLANPKNPNVDDDTQALKAAIPGMRGSILIVHASSDGEIETAFGRMKEENIDAAIISPDAYFADRSERIVALAARHKLPTIYDRRNSASAGGLIAFGPSFVDSYHRAGILVGRVLKGEKPADCRWLPPDKARTQRWKSAVVSGRCSRRCSDVRAGDVRRGPRRIIASPETGFSPIPID